MDFTLAVLLGSMALLFAATAIFFFYQNKFTSVFLAGMAGLAVFLAVSAAMDLMIAYLRPLRDDKYATLLVIAIQAIAIIAATVVVRRIWRKIHTLGIGVDN